VVGPFAASATILALMLRVFFLVITFSNAAAVLNNLQISLLHILIVGGKWDEKKELEGV
jgi:hypothetical protein